MTKMLEITVHNAYQDAVQGDYTDFLNNLSFTPTVQELNRNSSSPGQVSDGSLPEPEGEPEPLFGTHIREAAGTVKKLFRSR
jgi:hypothetical protein